MISAIFLCIATTGFGPTNSTTGCRQRGPRKNLTSCPGLVDRYNYLGDSCSGVCGVAKAADEAPTSTLGTLVGVKQQALRLATLLIGHVQRSVFGLFENAQPITRRAYGFLSPEAGDPGFELLEFLLLVNL